MRVWELAHLRFIPNEASRNELPYPAIYWNLSYRRPVLVRPVEPGFWTRYGSVPIDGEGYLYAGPKTRSVYSPPLLLPYTLVMRYLGLKLQFSALTVFYASRLAGLATYALLAWLALRLAPFGKWMLAMAALAPTSMFQATTIGADPASNGLALLFLAGCLAASVRKQIGWASWGGLLALSFVLFLAKVNLVFLALLPLLILPRARFRMRGGYLLLAGAMVTLAVVEVGGWSALAYPHLSSSASSAPPMAQAEYVVTHPLTVSGVFLSDLWANAPRYLRQWVAEYGYGYGSVPFPTYYLFAAAVLAAWWADSDAGSPSRRTRHGLLLTFLACMLGTSLSLYLAATPVGATFVEGIQGRYYAAIAPLLGMAGIGAVNLRPSPKAARLAMGFLLGSLVFFVVGLVLSYHVLCGASYYQSGLCFLPTYKNWAPNERYTSPISPTETLLQEVLAECDGLSEIRVWVNSSGLPAEGNTAVVFRDPSTDRDLATVTVANATLPSGGWLRLSFGPEWRSLGRLYLLRIGSVIGSDPVGTRVALMLREEYPEVKLMENQAPVDGDVVFQYGCAAGLGKLFPALRMPDGLED